MHLLPVLLPLIAAFIGIAGAIVSGLRLARPGRMLRPRRMVNYRVHYDDWLGTRTDIKGVAELVVRRKGQDVPDASLVMIRLSNEGGLDIDTEHWVMPVNFTFDGRDVVGVEVSDGDGVPTSLLTGDQERGRGEAPVAVAQATRQVLAQGASIRISKGKKALELPRIELPRKDRIRLLVLLSGQRTHRTGPGVHGDAQIKGSVRGGGLVREVTPGREAFHTLGWIGFALLALLAAVLVTLIVRPFSSPPAASHCVPGTIVAEGSTAFAPSVQAVGLQFNQVCRSVTISAAGSIAGASHLQASGHLATIRTTHLAMSDGAVDQERYPNLAGYPVAVVIFSVAVNREAKIYSLTVNDLVGIWMGKYKNWSQLGGADLPIDIVSRTAGSGTRATFDRKILGNQPELPKSSQNCTSRDLIPDSPVIRCEKSSTTDLLQAVNAIPGAIGYAEFAAASQSKYPDLDEIQLDGRDASPEAVKSGEYPFWAVEYLYTYGPPAPGSLLSAFLSYLDTDRARTILQSPDYGDIPCGLTTLCHS